MSYAVVMHIKDEEQHLETVLNGIKEQTIAPDKIVIVDDGSTDKTIDIIHKHDLPHIHIKQTVKTPYLRRAKAFNDLIHFANQVTDVEHYLKVDGDTLISENYAETLLGSMYNPIVAASSGISTEYRKTRDLNNGAVMYRKRTLPQARMVYGWDRDIQLQLIRAGYRFTVEQTTHYTDLRLPDAKKPSITRVIKNRLNTKLAELEGSRKQPI